MSMMMASDKLNIRQMQAYAALCLRAFCIQLHVKHDSINELISHLLSMLSTSSLPDWEQQGSRMSITGRGDPLPQGVKEIVPPQNLGLFNSLVEACVEVGIVDMYGESTNQPNIFLDKCVQILKSCEVELPSSEQLSKYGRGSDTWGEAISESELCDLLDLYGVNIS